MGGVFGEGLSGKGIVNDIIDPMGTFQGVKNTIAVMKGEEQFGAHDNWFGNGMLGETMNPMMGGKTSAQRKEWDDYYVQQAKNDAAWKQAMENNFRTSAGGTSVSAPGEPKYNGPGTPKDRRKNKVAKGGSLLTDPDAHSWLMEDT